MSVQTLFEKLQFNDEKNLLIQGLPSSIEKQFIKLSFAKCVTPLLRTRKIDFALIFAVSKKQLTDILNDITPALNKDAKLWVAYPKLTSKIASDLSRDCSWQVILHNGYEGMCQVVLDNVWSAIRFQKPQRSSKVSSGYISSDFAGAIEYNPASVEISNEFQLLLKKNKQVDTKEKRISAVLEKLSTGKKSPSAK